MDTNLILTAPVRMLISGIGDALATYYEAHAVSVAKKRTMAGGICSVTGLAIG
jgi:glycerol dehydrogenase